MFSRLRSQEASLRVVCRPYMMGGASQSAPKDFTALCCSYSATWHCFTNKRMSSLTFIRRTYWYVRPILVKSAFTYRLAFSNAPHPVLLRIPLAWDCRLHTALCVLGKGIQPWQPGTPTSGASHLAGSTPLHSARHVLWIHRSDQFNSWSTLATMWNASFHFSKRLNTVHTVNGFQNKQRLFR